MKLHSLHLKNFRLHADTTVTFPPEGILGLLGTNEAGKSTILEGIEWIIFGIKYTRGTKEGIRWFRAPARQTAAGRLRFEIGGHGYRVERTENDATVYSYPGNTVLAKGTAAVNAYLPGLLKMDHEAFSSSFMVKQKDVARIANLLPTERVAFIRSVMGMGKIDEALKACRKRKGELSTEREGLAAGLGDRLPLETAVDDATANVLAAQVRVRQDAGVVGDCAITAGEAVAARDESMEAAKENHRLTGEHGQASQSIQTIAVESTRLTEKLASIGEAAERVDEKQPVVDKLPALRLDKDVLVAARAAVGERNLLTRRVSELHDDITHREELVADAQKQIGFHSEDAWVAGTRVAVDDEAALKGLREFRNEQQATGVAEAASHNAEAERRRVQLAVLDEAGDDGVCPTCTRKLGKVFEKVRNGLVVDLGAATEAAQACRDQAATYSVPSDEEMEAEAASESATAEVDRLDTIREDAQRAKAVVARESAEIPAKTAALATAEGVLAGLPTAAFNKDEFDALERQITRLEDVDKGLADDRALVAQVEETRGLLQAQALADVTAQVALNAAVSAIATLGFNSLSHAALETDATEATEAEQKAKVTLAGSVEAEKFSGAQAESARRMLALYDERAVRLTEVDAKHLAHEHTAARLADFRVAIATTLRPEMEELMSGFVQILTDGRHESVELDEDFGAILYENGVPVEVISGGCEDIAALAMRLALSQMIAERAGHPLSLLILDEPFGSQDENRRGNILTLIRRLKGVFSQVVVISHVAETRDAVDHVVELAFDEGAGRARVVSSTYEEVA